MIYHILDIFFVVFHTALILFNILGYIWKRTRLINLLVLLLTGLSWLVLGFIVGTFGYCPLTDWHFKVLFKLGENSLPSSYLKYLSDRLTGLDLSESFVDNITLCVFIAAFSISLFINFRDFTRSGKKGKITAKSE